MFKTLFYGSLTESGKIALGMNRSRLLSQKTDDSERVKRKIWACFEI